MIDLAGKITAALDQAEAALNAADSDTPWAKAAVWEINDGLTMHGVGPEGFDDGDYAPILADQDGDADLIVSVVNREARQITLARALLEMAVDIRELPGVTVVLGNVLLKGLASTWCPEDAP